MSLGALLMLMEMELMILWKVEVKVKTTSKLSQVVNLVKLWELSLITQEQECRSVEVV